MWLCSIKWKIAYTSETSIILFAHSLFIVRMFGNTKPFGSPFGQTTQQSTFGKPAAFGSTTFGQQPAQPAFGCKHIKKQTKSLISFCVQCIFKWVIVG